MTTIHLGDCQTECITCTTNYHEQFKNIECDTCKQFIEGEPICNNCGQYSIHKTNQECPAWNGCDLCDNTQVMTEEEKTAQFHDWAGVYFYNEICKECFDRLESEI